MNSTEPFADTRRDASIRTLVYRPAHGRVGRISGQVPSTYTGQWINTTRSRYNAVNFPQNAHSRHAVTTDSSPRAQAVISQ